MCRGQTAVFRLIVLFAVVLSFAFLLVPAWAQGPQTAPRKIAVFGSSVASGAVDHEGKGGYAGRLGELLKPRGWEVVNVSRGGDNTVKIAPRFEAELLPQKPGYVIIGLSLSNEGIAKQPDTAYRDGIWEQWRTGMQGLIQRCRDAGMQVVVAGCYARNGFGADPPLYEYTRRMNIEINRWDVPSINFLGAIDNGAGEWAANFEADGGHPNGSGHQEMFLAIVPSLFEAMEAGKPIPAKGAGNRCAQLRGADDVAAPLSFVPGDAMHSFAVSFWVRPATSGLLAVVAGKAGVLRAAPWQRDDKTLQADLVEPSEEAAVVRLECRDGRIVCVTPNGEIGSPTLEGNVWHHVVVSHACARGASQLYVDGALAGSISERMIPATFFLGGGASPQMVAAADLKEWAVYRSSLNLDEARFVYEGNLYQSSLEVYAPLMDADFEVGKTVENRAQSMSEVHVVAAGLSAKEE